MQGDGNFVVYGPSGAGWNTGGSSADHIVMQTDGNLVSYNALRRLHLVQRHGTKLR